MTTDTPTLQNITDAAKKIGFRTAQNLSLQILLELRKKESGSLEKAFTLISELSPKNATQ